MLAIGIVCIVAQLVAQQQTQQGPITASEVRGAFNRAFGKTGMTESAVILVTDSAARGELQKFGATKSEQLRAAIAAFGPGPAQKEPGIIFQKWSAAATFPGAEPAWERVRGEYSNALTSLGRLIVTSRPAGASIDVDGNRWDQSTEADGYAIAGRRSVVVTSGSRVVRVQCEVRTEKLSTVAVNFDADSGIAPLVRCRSKRLGKCPSHQWAIRGISQFEQAGFPAPVN